VRPWGPIDWLLSKLPNVSEPVIVVGALAAEERCKAVPVTAVARGVRSILFLRIDDPQSRFTETIDAKVAANLAALEKANVKPWAIEHAFLFARDDLIAQLFNSIWRDNTDEEITLWLDITCLPKRFFFFLVKMAMRDERVRTLLATYTQPEPGRYTTDHLAEDPVEVQPLPAFGLVKNEPEQLVVAVGFEALGLAQLLSQFRETSREVYLLIPFPPGQPYSKRIWQTVQSIGPPADSNIRRLHALNPFDAYTVIENLVDNGTLQANPPALAPYGPKPLSLGMCLFALDYGAAVYYTQPALYHPDYTTGIGTTWAYCLKLNGVAVRP